MNWDRVDAARRRGRALFAIAGFAIFIAVLLLIGAPSFTDPSFGPPQPAWSTLLTIGIGIAGVLFGLASMWRIYKAPTKYASATWRYRDRN
jgi:hypothetical protein